MNWKAKLKSASFWTAIGGAVVILLRAFGVEMGGTEVEAVINAVCGLLVMFGIFNDNGIACAKSQNILDLADKIIDLSGDVTNTTEEEKINLENIGDTKDVEIENNDVDSKK